MIYVLSVSVVNPVTSEQRSFSRSFDPALLTLAKWDSLFAGFQLAITDLQATSAAKEPSNL